MGKKRLNKMKRTLQTIISFLPLVLITMSGCSKSGVCISNSGTIIREERRVGDFDSIAVYNFVNIILTQDSVNKVVVEAGQNIISGITTDVSDHLLTIDNTLKCNWLRSYSKPINVYISVKSLQKIYYLGSGNITSTNTLTSSLLKLDIWGGCGSINLGMNVPQGIFALQLGTTDITLHGNCSYCSIYQGDYGTFQCKDLRTGECRIISKGSNDCYINVSHFLFATINAIGNIYYTGQPDSLEVQITGSGQLIHF
jgi:hypothetical protein